MEWNLLRLWRHGHCPVVPDMGNLVTSPVGDAALPAGLSDTATRRRSGGWQPQRKRYERQGILVEEARLAKDEEECRCRTPTSGCRGGAGGGGH